jgi:hypothetical protein
MTNNDVIALGKVLNQVSHLRGKKFAYAVYKNKAIIEKEIEIFNELRKEPHSDFNEYEQERANLCINFSRKDENGSPKKVNGPQGEQYDIEDMDGFQIEFQKLQDKYPQVIEHLEKTKKEIDDFLNSESEIELVKVSIDDIPEDVDANTIDALKFIIKD